MERRRLQPILWNYAPYFVCPFVYQESPVKYYCLLCNDIIYSPRVLISHVNRNYHKTLLDYHGRYITPLENDLYSCKVCNCVIPHYTNVHNHLNARTHSLKIQRFEENRDRKERLDSITAKANEFYNRLQNILIEGSAGDCDKANAVSSNEHGNRLDERRQEKRATKNVKGKAIENNNICSSLEEKKAKKGVTNNVEGEAIENNNICSSLEEKKAKKGATNNVEGKAIENNNICSSLEEKKAEKGATNYVRIKAVENNNIFSRLEKKGGKNGPENNVIAKANERNNDLRRLEEKCDEKGARNNIKAKDNETNKVCSLLEKQGEEKGANGENKEYNCLKVQSDGKWPEASVQANKNNIYNDKAVRCSSRSKDSSFLCSSARNFDVESKKPEGNESFKYYSTDNTDKKILSGMAHNISCNDTSSTQDSGIEENILTSPSPSSEKLVEPENTKYASIKTYNQTFVDLLDFQSDMYDLRDRITATSLSMHFCLQTEKGQIYCLVCHRIVGNASDICTEHLCSLDLWEYREKVLENAENSYEFAGEFGQLNLASQYMECFSEKVINCLVCNSEVENVNFAIQNHVRGDTHSQKLQEMCAKMKKVFEKITSRWLFDWYKVQKYSCIPCSEKFESEFEFAKHLNTKEHTDALKKAKDYGCPFVYDFCGICAIFWCGYRDSYVSHCDTRLHKWFKRNGECVASKLPECAEKFLSKLKTQNDDAVDSVDAIFAKEEINKMKLVESLENLKLAFPYTQGYTFGSNISSHSVIDVFLGCAALYAISAEKLNDGRTFTEDDILYYMMSVNSWMSEKPEIWNLKPLTTGGRSPIISAIHRPTGSACDISFDNRLVISGLEFIDAFDVIFPQCYKLTNYLIQWLAYCKFTGSEHISSYVLYWLLVFYLQKESILSSVVALTQPSDGLQVGGPNKFVEMNASNDHSLKKLLIGFFNFYAKFDFRHDVACPLIGEAVKKRSFAYPENLPIEMGSYVADIMYSNNPEEFPIDLPMCIQDPFSLNHNLSKNVSKVDLSYFRTYCKNTANFLGSP